MDSWPPGAMSAVIGGYGQRPYVNRMLVPWIVQFCQTFLSWLIQPISSTIRQASVWEDFDRNFYPETRLVVYAISISCFFFFAVLVRAITAKVYGFQGLRATLAGLCGMLLIPLFFRYFNYIYDPMTIFLSAALIYALFLENLNAAALIFLVAAVNKENALFYLPVIYLTFKRQGSEKQLELTMVLLLVCYGGIQYGIQSLHASNTGDPIAIMKDHNLKLFSWRQWPVPLMLFVIGLGFYKLIRPNWATAPYTLKLGLYFVLAPLVFGAMIIGFLDELRAYYEAFPYLILLAMPSFMDLIIGPMPSPSIETTAGA
ncbi:MAG: hypothetical protein JSS72_05195 [Armatimonadetes bacterium]|nr:hypothetical protein [Armatimonadota bacterium]